MVLGCVTSRPPCARSVVTQNQHPNKCRACSAARPGSLPRRSLPPPPPAVRGPARRLAARLAAAGDPEHAAGSSSKDQEGTAEQLRQLQEAQQLFEAIEQCVQRAEELEGEDKLTEAINLVQAELEALQAKHGDEFALIVLQQVLWDLLLAAGRHSEALRNIAVVHEAVKAAFGAGSIEQRMMDVRLGVSIAACGQLEDGLNVIYEAQPVLQQQFAALMERAAQMAAEEEARQEWQQQQAAGSTPDAAAAAQAAEEAALQAEAERETLQDNINRLGAALGESNFFGGMLTIRRAVQMGQQAGAVLGWEELEDIIISGFANLMLAAGGSGGNLNGALREHDRLTQELSGDAMLARLVQVQNLRLRDMSMQGLEHPLFQQQQGQQQGQQLGMQQQ
ncbi:signal recognition particle-docking [Chlorella sorokiniana]|uniref:Signal recognition particle-docking n=1 Tax=Chlorella sorokiniana TaxID=3076 RepID=A0A2P6TJX8_CHLSO|nr:signal recognition particle-docking [Chlorella sorokiniana]|eukprot:PRW44390.1 signal recognition particle-docking [Chlorella sorokiniana]